MADWLTTLPGTATGAQLAVLLAVNSAFFHALFGALQKGKVDPWISRGAIDACIAVISAPVALFFVPWPSGTLWLLLIGAMVIHFIYKLTLALAYERAAYTVVYPVVRGASPVVTVAAASVIFGESYTLVQWLGVACLSGGILALSAFNIRQDQIAPEALKTALIWAMLCGITVAVYTTWDAYGIRMADHPFTFLAWFFLLTSLDFPGIAWRRWRRMQAPPPLGPLVVRGVIGALVAYISFGGVMLATYFDKVGEAAVLRETSPVFAALLGWLFLREEVGWHRTAMILLIAVGAVIVEVGQ